jgi:hypothetical protein
MTFVVAEDSTPNQMTTSSRRSSENPTNRGSGDCPRIRLQSNWLWQVIDLAEGPKVPRARPQVALITVSIAVATDIIRPLRSPGAGGLIDGCDHVRRHRPVVKRPGRAHRAAELARKHGAQLAGAGGLIGAANDPAALVLARWGASSIAPPQPDSGRRRGRPCVVSPPLDAAQALARRLLPPARPRIRVEDPPFVHTMRGPNTGTGTSSGHAQPWPISDIDHGWRLSQRGS